MVLSHYSLTYSKKCFIFKRGPIVFIYGFIFLFLDPRRNALHDLKLQMIHICVALGLGTASLFNHCLK